MLLKVQIWLGGGPVRGPLSSGNLGDGTEQLDWEVKVHCRVFQFSINGRLQLMEMAAVHFYMSDAD